MKLKQLANNLGLTALGDTDPEIFGITDDSRKVTDCDMFAAVKGTALDGRNFIGAAKDNGAAAVILAPPDLADIGPRILTQGPEADFRRWLALAARLIYGAPDEKLRLIGLTGTNGKSTVSYLLEAILLEAGISTGVIGTVDFRWPGGQTEAPNTTPEGPLLFKTLNQMVKSGCRAAVMEVSSHGLELGRIAGLKFEAALFTNLTRDHLDFHGGMEEYYLAKRRLFFEHLSADGRAVISADDPYGQRLISEVGNRAITFSLGAKADVCGLDLTLGRQGLSMTVVEADRKYQVQSPLLGRFNALNILAACALAKTLGIEIDQIQSALARSSGAPGRLQKVGGDYLALVDYAHTPGALATALESLRALGPDRLIAVFGCGGDRDRGKRPLMGAEAGKLADLAIVTSDNPRTEDPLAIIEEASIGLTALGLKPVKATELGLGSEANDSAGSRAELKAKLKDHFLVVPDRRQAIRLAVNLMEQGDLVLVAGKGHETYQIIGRQKIKFDDVQEVAAALKEAGRL
ncbi:MAG: UDP-N-acetylmuramoyl-L-alanyl-D-glutamate--2,6-diaminopimelate ligase [Deltaproteobacteria bacterium]|nr:UDP-N-acetylmuramoyl-L-alanyl-D-glutamate--2,6-diaminopimelate ligase [Deltaproteobacteria bacterium]